MLRRGTDPSALTSGSHAAISAAIPTFIDTKFISCLNEHMYYMCVVALFALMFSLSIIVH